MANRSARRAAKMRELREAAATNRALRFRLELRERNLKALEEALLGWTYEPSPSAFTFLKPEDIEPKANTEESFDKLVANTVTTERLYADTSHPNLNEILDLHASSARVHYNPWYRRWWRAFLKAWNS